MNIPEGAASYAAEFSGKMIEAFAGLDSPDFKTRRLIVAFLLNAFAAGHRKGLEDGHKTKWAVVLKKYDQPHLPGSLFANGLTHEVAVEVCRTANRLRSGGDLYFEIEPEEPLGG